jgi:hypothetical protein
MTVMYSPRGYSSLAAIRDGVQPLFWRCGTSRTRSSERYFCTTASESSDEQSSTTISSKSRNVWRRTDSMQLPRKRP